MLSSTTSLYRALRGFDPLSMVLWTPNLLFAHAPAALAAGFAPAPPVLAGFADGLHTPSCERAPSELSVLKDGELERALAHAQVLCPWCSGRFVPLSSQATDPSVAWVLHTALLHVALDRLDDPGLAAAVVHSAWHRDDTELVAALAPRVRGIYPARTRNARPYLVIVARYDPDARWAWVFDDYGTPKTAAFAAPAWLASTLPTLRVPLDEVADPHAVAALVEAGISLTDAVTITA